ncbi:MAG: chondroitinase family polysaccharide lyase [Bacteroidaceae bacterium]
MKELKRIMLAVLATAMATGAFGQWVGNERLLSFEGTEVPAYVVAGEGSETQISNRHWKDGASSLQWTFAPGAELSIRRDLRFEAKDPTGKDTYLSAFCPWIYSEKPMNDSLRFRFLKNGRECCSFVFHLRFTGWRTGIVVYERDMQGVPEEGMNEVRITAPGQAGILYLDHVVTGTKMDLRPQNADLQVPFVNKGFRGNNWVANSRLTPYIPQEAVLTDTQREELACIEERFRGLMLYRSEVSDAKMEALRRDYACYEIQETEDGVTGHPIFYIVPENKLFERISDTNIHQQLQQGYFETRHYFATMKNLASAYLNAVRADQREELAGMFVRMYRHLTDQGFAYGSCVGSMSLYGYGFRDFFTAYYMMKDVLAKEGLQEEASRTLLWYSNIANTFRKPNHTGADVDEINTLSMGRICSVLSMPDTPQKAQYLKSFAAWLNNGFLPSQGLEDGFKQDGAVYHHSNNYPAYGVGGLEGATRMIYLLHGTSFAIAEAAHANVKHNLLTMRFYCNKRFYPLAMSGRHPDGKGTLVPRQFGLMALSGTPDGSQEVDGEMASAFLRLVSDMHTIDRSKEPEYMPEYTNLDEKGLATQLAARGFNPEPHPQGNLALGYGCLSVHRRDQWSAVVRGHSRYLWAAEHYIGANLYGRYLAHGSMQLMTAPEGEPVTSTSGGWQQEGFDWGRIPGTTAVHLPVDQLKADVRNADRFSGYEEMLYSDEAFAGGLSQNHINGNYGMKLHEHDKYNGSLRARKSYHFFEGTIVCLGSGIECANTDYPTETTVLQQAVKNAEEDALWSRTKDGSHTYLDPFGTGYYVPGDCRFTRNRHQQSRLQNTGAPTEGDWVTLTIDHGYAPKGATYAYAVVPGTTGQALAAFAKSPSYRILQQDERAHIVTDKEGRTSYVLFETPQSLPKGLVQRVDTTCLLMTHQEGKTLHLTVSQPDLALYRGAPDETYDENGKRVERSIASHPWKDDPSLPIPVTVTLKGRWTADTLPDNCRIVSATKKETVLEFICKDAASFDAVLKR